MNFAQEPMRPPPHPVLEAALAALRLLHEDPKERRVLQEVGRLYHEGFPGAPKGVVPLSAVYAFMSYVELPDAFAANFTALGSLLHALGLWRLSKGAYLFDPDLAREVAATPVGRLPVELLFHLPEPAPLVLLPEGLPAWPEVEGFHIALEWDPGGRPGISPHLELRFLAWVRGERGHHPATLVLDLDAEDLEEAARKTLARSIREARGLAAVSLWEARPLLEREYGTTLGQLLSLALYLCQEAPDLGGVAPRPPAPLVRVKGGKKVFPPGEPLILPTGWRWGKAIRLARERREREPSAPTGRRVAPHVRRAHWHLYWTGEGSRKDPSRAKPLLRWVPATLVNRDLLEEAGLTPEDLPAVVRRVKEKPRAG
jgi:hypothetical protein